MPERHTPPVFCVLPTTLSAGAAKVYQRVHELNCADKRAGHRCAGKTTIDLKGITLSCPRCGDHRSLYPAQEGMPP